MNLADKLKILGVKIGTADIPPPALETTALFPIETVVAGQDEYPSPGK
ncbi:MAG: hypothetical protein ACUVRJ_00195 [Candidatus Villigracilaceae bacterium]